MLSAVSDLDGFSAGTAVVAESAATLAVDADLRLELTTAAGASSVVRVTGHGRRVRVDAERPEVFLTELDRADVGRLADLLAAAGISVGVHGPRGPVATLGAGTSNRLGRFVTGSARVAPARGGALVLWANRPVRVISSALLFALAFSVVGWLRRNRG